MWHRFAALVLALVLVSTASAQKNNVYSKAVPPDKAVLNRLNLKIEWTLFLPVEGTRDALAEIQTIDDQVFVQTRAGYLLAIDAPTGRIQWAAQLGNGSYGNAYPVAANSQFVFCAHVTKLYAFYRYTGATEFVAELGSPPTTGLVADETGVYCVLGMRTGNAGAHRVTVYDLPRPINITQPGKAAIDPLGRGANSSSVNPVDDLMKRYKPGTGYSTQPEVFNPTNRPKVMEVPIGGLTATRTPSLQALPSVVPPYSLDNRAPAPSLNTLPSLRQPYHVRLESAKYIQQTPSLNTIPPSVAASLLLADLRPKAVAPPVRWEYGLTSRILYPLTLTPTRVWAVTDAKVAVALNKNTKGIEAMEKLANTISAPPSQSGLTNYVPLGNGDLVAVDATAGNVVGGLQFKWRSVVGGINNRKPYVTEGFVYAAGDNTGVACVNRESGDLIWKSADSADRVIGANKEFVYIRNRQGRLLVFDAKRATDPARKKSSALGSIDLSEFNVHIVNTANDRIYLAADNGLIVCLRDANPKYAKPVQIWPPPIINATKKIGVDTQPDKDGTPPDPKKDPDPKMGPDPKKQ
ncbi:MAG: PQQ-binding-like beta-propeller repeat protein [Planctomycetia bacterium]|nr:PQQ-binding-like beta-propeller repeat protein [Planctomycetia bacterium]